MTALTLTSYAALLEALSVVRTARERVAELGFEASTVDVHGVPRALFDRLPGVEERGQYGSYEPFWSKSIGGVNVYCDEPPVPVIAGEKVLS
ncbi:MAG: hypothetical protein AVDCRST_MAG86-2213 [uncultured Truepera sp.]|uniref:Uncharacterized protein n=1 Tax=uncultured Truepera sp. TaxID=543023 RepID=A0A6J4VDR3_9DEIN|nr:MAG: hypothetical protein AVDCRST_MAG86-2213 [uncultured Truepera sp.]